jgi:hypothetical protein
VDECKPLTHGAFFKVWKHYGFTPEGFNIKTGTVQPGQKSYPLRPELVESTYYLHRATGDPYYLSVGRDMLAGVTLAHYSAQPKRFLWDRGCVKGVFRGCLRGAMPGVVKVWLGGVFLSDTAQVELRRGRVQAPAWWRRCA